MKKLSLYLLVFTLVSSSLLLSFMWKTDAPNQEENNELFKEFIDKFPQGELPYEISIDAYVTTEKDDDQLAEKSIDEERYISTKFAAFIPGLMRAQYSRRPPPTFQFEEKLYENDLFVTVVYSVIPSFTSLMNQPNEYVLATYQKGTVIKPFKRMISSITLSEKNQYVRLGKVNEDLTVQVKSYTRDRSSKTGQGKLHSTKEYAIAASGAITKIDTKIDTKIHAPKPSKKVKTIKKADRAK